MFAYCNNNPVDKRDSSGESALLAVAAITLTGAFFGGMFGAISAAKSGGDVLSGFLEGAFIGGGSALIGTSGAAFAPLAAAGFGLVVDVLWQGAEITNDVRDTPDVGRMIKAALGAGIGSLTVGIPGLDPLKGLPEAIASLVVTKPLSILFGIFDVATAPEATNASQQSGLVQNGAGDRPVGGGGRMLMMYQ